MRYHRRIFGRNALRILGLVAVLVPLACADAAGDADPATSSAPASTVLPRLDLPTGLTVFVEYPRYLHAARRLEVGFDNASETSLTVSELALRSPLFEPAAPEEPETVVAPGRRRDLQIGLGGAVCPAPAGPSLVEVTATVDGDEQHGLVEIDPAPLDRISAQECGSAFVLENVALGFAQGHTVVDGEVATTIDVDRLEGDEPVTVDAIRGSVLIELRPTTDSTPLATLPTGETALSIPVRLRVIRCDAHAVTESKKTFIMAIWVAVGEREPQRVLIELEGELRAALQGLIEDCVREEAG